MTKATCLLVLTQLVSSGLSAQTFDEWFEQKKTQIRYLKLQIAALAAFIGVSEEGNGIAREGTAEIEGTEDADLTMHSDYFAALVTVKPSIGGSAVVNDILDRQSLILSLSGLVRQEAAGLPQWASLVDAFCEGLLADCSRDMDLLKALTTNGGVQMTDDARMQAIDQVDGRTKARYAGIVEARNQVLFMLANYRP